MIPLEAKLAEARKNFQYDPEEVNDGIQMAQWKEWDGEIIKLTREDTRWVWKKLKKLEELEDLVTRLRRELK